MFRSFAPGEAPATVPRSYADMKKANSTPSGSKIASDDADHLEDERTESFMEISKLYFYTEVVDLLPIKMVQNLLPPLSRNVELPLTYSTSPGFTEQQKQTSSSSATFQYCYRA